MFQKLNLTKTTSTRKSAFAFPLTTAFVQALTKEGYRISYTALRNAAHELGEDSSNQKPAQRGAFLAKQLPADLQPSVSRKDGTYHEKVLTAWTVVVDRAELGTRPVITQDSVIDAIRIWEESNENESDEAIDEADEALDAQLEDETGANDR